MADDLLVSIGGCASNVAIDLARLGVRSAICGRVGADAFGRFVTESLSSSGVDVTWLRTDSQLATSQTLIINVRGQDRRFIHCFGANRGFTALDLAPTLSPAPRVLYVGGFFVMPGLDPSALAEQFAKARRSGTFTVLDVACPGPADYLEQLEPLLPHTDLFLPNADEGTLILNEPDPKRQALRFLEMGAQRVVITQGEHGAHSASQDLKVRLGTYPVTLVDGSGGGDAFDAGYIAGILDGLDEVSCLKLASAVGASCVRGIGTTAAVFTRAEADAFIAQNPIEIEPF
jgi:sugar/nucleoside kinase (ribokinase family)